jgi:hypothetical protein
MKSGNLNFMEISGPLQACNELLYLYLYLFYFISNKNCFHLHYYTNNIRVLFIAFYIVRNCGFVKNARDKFRRLLEGKQDMRGSYVMFVIHEKCPEKYDTSLKCVQMSWANGQQSACASD